MDAVQLKSRLESFLGARDYPAEVSGVEQIVGGFSQITYKFHANTGDVVETLVLRSDRPGGATLTLTDRDLEYQVIKFLNDAGAPVPLVRWADRDGSELGTRSLISDFVPGSNLLQATRSGQLSSADAALVVAEAAAAISGNTFSKDCLTWRSATRSWGRLGPASDGSTLPRSSAMVSE